MNVQDTYNTLVFGLHLSPPPEIRDVSEIDSVSKIDTWISEALNATKQAIPVSSMLQSFFQSTGRDGLKQQNISGYINDGNFWDFILKQESVLSAYEITRRFLSLQNPLDVTKFSRITLPNGENFDEEKNANKYGLYYLLKNVNESGKTLAYFDKDYKFNIRFQNFLPIKIDPDDELKISNLTASQYSGLKSYVKEERKKHTDRTYTINEEIELMLSDNQISELRSIHLYYLEKLCSNEFNDKAEKLLSSLCRVTNPLQLTNNTALSKDVLTQLSTLELFQYIHKHKVEDVYASTENTKYSSIDAIIFPQNSETSYFKSTQYDALLASYNRIVHDLQLPGLSNDEYKPKQVSKLCKLELADKVHLRYQIEKLLSPALVDCMYKRITFSTDESFLKSNIALLAECSLLPNVFSRYHIMQSAIDNLGLTFMKISDYGETSPDLAMHVDKQATYRSPYEHKLHWKSMYSDLMHILANYIFPVYGSYFFVTLWNSIRTKVDSDSKCTAELFMVLSKYLNSEKMVQKLLSFDEVHIKCHSNLAGIIKNEEIYRSCVSNTLHPFEKYNYKGPSRAINDEDPDQTIDYAIYRICAREIADIAKYRSPQPMLINNEFTKKLFEVNGTSPLRFFYKGAKKISH